MNNDWIDSLFDSLEYCRYDIRLKCTSADKKDEDNILYKEIIIRIPYLTKYSRD